MNPLLSQRWEPAQQIGSQLHLGALRRGRQRLADSL